MAVAGTLEADGDTQEFTVLNNQNTPGSNWVHLHLSGDFGSGTFQLYFEVDNGIGYKPIKNADFTEAEDKWIQLKPGTKIKGTLSGSTSPSLVYSMR